MPHDLDSCRTNRGQAAQGPKEFLMVLRTKISRFCSNFTISLLITEVIYRVTRETR